jgi:hypothetical protein
MNQATTPSSAEARPHKWYRLPLSNDQREELRTSIHSYFQNAESSSIGQGIRQTKAALAVLCAGIFPDGIQVALIEGDFFVCKGEEERIPIRISAGHPDDPGPRGDNASDFDWYDGSKNS